MASKINKWYFAEKFMAQYNLDGPEISYNYWYHSSRRQGCPDHVKTDTNDHWNYRSARQVYFKDKFLIASEIAAERNEHAFAWCKIKNGKTLLSPTTVRFHQARTFCEENDGQLWSPSGRLHRCWRHFMSVKSWRYRWPICTLSPTSL